MGCGSTTVVTGRRRRYLSFVIEMLNIDEQFGLRERTGQTIQLVDALIDRVGIGERQANVPARREAERPLTLHVERIGGGDLELHVRERDRYDAKPSRPSLRDKRDCLGCGGREIGNRKAESAGERRDVEARRGRNGCAGCHDTNVRRTSPGSTTKSLRCESNQCAGLGYNRLNDYSCGNKSDQRGCLGVGTSMRHEPGFFLEGPLGMLRFPELPERSLKSNPGS